MEQFEILMNELTEEMDKLKISKELQIKYLKEYINFLEKNQDKKLGSFAIGIFISGMGLGMLPLSNCSEEILIGVFLSILGIIISFIINNDYDITLEEIQNKVNEENKKIYNKNKT